MKKVAVVILNYNGEQMMRRFLPVLLSNTSEEIADIVVADNASTDDSISMLEAEYPSVRIIKLDQNYGFAEGYNRAIERCEEEFIVMLNSDVEVTKGWIEPLLEEVETAPSVAAVQPKILSWYDRSKFEHAGAAGGYIDCLGYPLCRGRVLDNIETDNGQYDTRAKLLWTSGAAMLIRRKDYMEVGGMDKDFFAHQEEIDLCWRLCARGRILTCSPDSVVYHIGGGTLPVSSPRKTYLNFRNNLLLIYKNSVHAKSVLFFRFFLDYLAAFSFLLKGEYKNFQAVFKARRDYHRMKKDMKKKREENIKLTIHRPEGILNKSILIYSMMLGRKTFSSLMDR